MFADIQSSSLLWNIDIDFTLKVVTHFCKIRGLEMTKVVFSHLLEHTVVSISSFILKVF